MYEVIVSIPAQKELGMLPHLQRKAIILSLRDMREEPFSGKPLTRGLTGRFSYRVGVYRIIYKINKRDKVVTVLTVGHRATVYG